MIVLCLAGLLLSGCSRAIVVTPLPSEVATVTASVESSEGAALSPDDPSRVRVDTAGRTPDQAVLALVAALGRADWKTAYSSYATPTVDFATAKREWIDANESYRGFTTLEVRVTADEMAWVRVAYRDTVTPPAGDPYEVVVDPPGEWWPVHKVAGTWKTQWMPRQ